MKNIQIFYNCAFCRAGILYCLEPDHIRRGRQGMPTHFLSQDGNTSKQFCGTIPPTGKTLCCPISQLFVLMEADMWFALPFHPGMFSLLSPRHPALPHPASFLPEMSEVRTLSFGTWEFGGIFWHYRAASVLYHAISCYTITVTV